MFECFLGASILTHKIANSNPQAVFAKCVWMMSKPVRNLNFQTSYKICIVLIDAAVAADAATA